MHSCEEKGWRLINLGISWTKCKRWETNIEIFSIIEKTYPTQWSPTTSEFELTWSRPTWPSVCPWKWYFHNKILTKQNRGIWPNQKQKLKTEKSFRKNENLKLKHGKRNFRGDLVLCFLKGSNLEPLLESRNRYG